MSTDVKMEPQMAACVLHIFCSIFYTFLHGLYKGCTLSYCVLLLVKYFYMLLSNYSCFLTCSTRSHLCFSHAVLITLHQYTEANSTQFWFQGSWCNTTTTKGQITPTESPFYWITMGFHFRKMNCRLWPDTNELMNHTFDVCHFKMI